MEERVKLPMIWFIIMGLVVVGFIANLTINIFASGGLSVWPFIAAVSLLLVINQASDENAVGVPPLQAYGLFAGVLVGFFIFVALVSRINPWVVVALTLGAGAWLVYDWKLRLDKQRELQRRRLAGLCVRCLTPVKDGLDEFCPNCDLPVNPERLNLFRLGKAIANKAQSGKTRAVLTGQKPGQVHKKLQNLQQARAYKYKKGK